jgi:tetratricopeptide (TPR) repeat protein
VVGASFWVISDVLRTRAIGEAARLKVRTAQYVEADPLLDSWLKRAPRSGEGHLWKARNALALRRPPGEVSALYQRAREFGCPRADLEVIEAIAMVRQGRHREAETTLRRVFELDARPDAQVDEALAEAYLENYALNAASEVIDRWSRDVPNDPKPYLWRVEIDRRLESRANAVVDDYREALKRDPSLDDARLGLAEGLRKAHRNREAESEFSLYLARHPEAPVALLGAGRNARELGDDETAGQFLDRALKAAPRDVEALRERADVALRKGSFAEALALLDRALALDPYEFGIRYNRGLALRRLGRAEEAEKDFAESSRLRTEHAELNQARSILAKHPNDRTQQIKIARWMFIHGHADEGVRWAEKIVRDQPGQPEACSLLADHYAKIGKPGLANSYRAQIAARAEETP